MSYNGSGTFNINTTGQPVVAGTVISSSAFNSLTSDLATGLSTAITKDGQTTTTARITFAQGITSSLVTDSSSVSTGSIITAGGAGIAKNLYVGGALDVAGATTFTNPVINNIKMGYTTTATAAGTTTLTVSSNYRQFFTGSTTQTIVLPVTSTLVTGIAYEIENNSTGTLTVNSSGGNLVGTVPAGVCAHAVCIGTTLTTAADWDWDYISTTTITGTGANVLGTSPTITTPVINGFTGDTSVVNIGSGQFYKDASGNVGLGTTSPVSYGKFSIVGTTSTSARVVTTTGAALGRYTNTSGDLYVGVESSTGSELSAPAYSSNFYGATAYPMLFWTNSVERMRILSGGAVCVNTTSAQVDGTSKLVVATTTASGIAAEFSNNTSGTCTLAIANTGAATSTLVNWYAANAYRSAITWNGSLIVYGTSSDARLKENITDSGSGLAKLADVKIRSFDWKESGAHTDFGVVAQELQAVAPEAVLVGKDNEDGSIKESWSVDSSVLVPAMIKAIQELKAINDSLTARIVALESK